MSKGARKQGSKGRSSFISHRGCIDIPLIAAVCSPCGRVLVILWCCAGAQQAGRAAGGDVLRVRGAGRHRPRVCGVRWVPALVPPRVCGHHAAGVPAGFPGLRGACPGGDITLTTSCLLMMLPCLEWGWMAAHNTILCCAHVQCAGRRACFVSGLTSAVMAPAGGPT